MVVITLPDGSQREYPNPVSGFDIVESIGPGLAKAAVAMVVDGTQKDLSTVITGNATVKILTPKDEEGLDVVRHTLAAQVLARAVKILYPDALLAIGPTIDNGFYYDIDFKAPITPEDLPAIEAKMREIIKEGLDVTREMHPRAEAIEYFAARGETYKVDIITRAPEDQTEISLYRQGDNGEDIFTDLCVGPHLPSIKKANIAFKLMNVAGAYWRGDSNNKMLTRIYAVAFASEKELKAHLAFLEEVSKRDHRRIGKAQELFHLQEEAPGMVFWHPNGWQLWQIIEQYMRERQKEEGYLEIKTPMVVDRSLWEKSGHWENYRENMFTTASENRDYAVKPMNCPCHVQVFNHGLHSYRDLPLRLAEFGSCHRNEPSGALHGIMRVRGFVQDDAHIFCRIDQVVSEVENFHRFAMSVYDRFGFENIAIKLSLRPEERAGSDEVWDKAEEGLRIALKAAGVEWEELPGEGAFYGPKVEYHIKDAIGRSWQVGTIQLDFVLPERLDAEFVDEDNTRKRPVMLHRAILGSFERFIGILIEHHAGSFPFWLAPVQAFVAGITSHQDDYVKEIEAKLKKANIRTKIDLRNEKIGYKIREATIGRIPYLLVVGKREAEEGLVSVRTREGEDLGTMTLEAAIDLMNKD
ncbi:threonine--tRNA ligase [Wohlfahrtiimonas chitiniclastica]|uniref:threonine--tRNA ligase n=1 Tax=Wohlfahrtiimonas chitiniclastica TaxID=400946 RepID=UPI0007B41D0C|nr:threonine--tRNA ligase [Wohlfahrtiimonas chitiniclastica]KZS23117.1 threonine--tRNA ligase [Wohlfahrtiimonas chitiniclastica]WHR55545.1 threonine--tRNA ligase [Wohlfahrtiimonas chitiniclastica]